MSLALSTVEKVCIVQGFSYRHVEQDRIDIDYDPSTSLAIYVLGDWLQFRILIANPETTAAAQSAKAVLNTICLLNMRALGGRVTVDCDGSAYLVSDINAVHGDEAYFITLLHHLAFLSSVIKPVLIDVIKTGVALDDDGINAVFDAG